MGMLIKEGLLLLATLAAVVGETTAVLQDKRGMMASLDFSETRNQDEKLTALEEWVMERQMEVEKEQETPETIDATNLHSTIEVNLGRLVEATDAMGVLAGILESNGDDSPPLLKEFVYKAVTHANKTKDMAHTVVEAVLSSRNHTMEESARSSRKLGDNDDDEPPQQETWSKNPSTPFAHHPRVKQELRKHAALQRGDTSFAERMLEQHLSRHAGGKDKTRRRQLEEANTRLQAENDCIKLLECINSYTLMDLITYFWFDDITEDGEFSSVTMNFDAEDIWQKGKDIQEALKGFKKGEEVRDTEQFPEKCNALLRLFHQNEEFEEYAQNKAASWREVCRSEGNTRYVQFSQIEERFGDKTTDRVFEDAVMCASNIDATVFFTEDHQPRVPTGFNSYAVDRHGKVMDPNEYFEFQVLDTMESIEISPGTALEKSSFRNNFKSKCGKDVRRSYKKSFNTISPYYVDENNEYPPLIISCSRSGTGNDFQCEGSIGQSKLDCGSVTLSRGDTPSSRSQALEFEDTHKMRGLFSSATNRDETLLMLLGESISNGLLCAHREPPGFCCLDLPGENQGPEFWGENFQCEHGEEQCSRLGPLLSGFSEETCQMYSGVYCAYPRDCSSLKHCVENELEWAILNGKKQFQAYLEESPEIEDPLDQVICGEVREYFGFDADFPNDDEVCEDIELLRYNQNFDSLDAFAADEPPVGEVADLPDDVDAVTAVPLPPLNAPGETLHTANFHLQVTRWLHAFEHFVDTADQVYSYTSTYECVTFPFFTKFISILCRIAKNIAVVLSGFIVWALKRILFAVQFAYEENDTLSDFNMDEIYQDVSVIYTNMGVLHSGFQSIGDQNAANTNSVIERFDQLFKINNENTEQTFTQFNFVGTRFDTVDQTVVDLSELIKDTCRSRRRHLLEDDASDYHQPRGPKLEVPHSVGFVGGWDRHYELDNMSFQNVSTALAFLERTLILQDLCGDRLEADMTLSVREETDCRVVFEAMPICVDDQGQATYNGTPHWFAMKVDKEPPLISCGFLKSTDPTLKTLVVREGEGKFDSGLWISATDDCSASADVDVDVSVYSNEMEERNTVLLTTSLTAGGVKEATVFLTANTCHDLPNSHFCVSKDNLSDRRVYAIKVTGRDKSGRTAEDTCHVTVLPNSAGGGEVDGATRELRGTTTTQHVGTAQMKSTSLFALGNLSLGSK